MRASLFIVTDSRIRVTYLKENPEEKQEGLTAIEIFDDRSSSITMFLPGATGAARLQNWNDLVSRINTMLQEEMLDDSE